VRPEEIRPLSIRSEVRSSTQRPETTNRRSLLSRAISNSLWISQLLTNIERPERLERWERLEPVRPINGLNGLNVWNYLNA